MMFERLGGLFELVVLCWIEREVGAAALGVDDEVGGGL